MQLSGTNKYQPARQDLNAPDLYIPITALWSYCLSVGFGLFTQKAFKPEVIYNTVSLSFGAWIFHALIIKVILWVLRIPNVSFMELFAYAGYSFVYGCMVLLGRLYIGMTLWRMIACWGQLVEFIACILFDTCESCDIFFLTNLSILWPSFDFN